MLFIPHESHRSVIKNFYKVTKTDVIPIDTEVSLKTSMSDNTLLYSWGSAAHGKLGTGIATSKECEQHSDFVRYDLGRSFEKLGNMREN